MNLMDLFIKLSVDDKASDQVNKISKNIKKGVTTAVTVAVTALATLTATAIKSYSQFEQLVGGAELMFGDAFKTVMNNAKTAYKTVQMSQNEYLQQVNGFATGLKTALGGNEQAAAELAHKIIVAEADIVAATGNTQEAVQNAFNGIMKSNFTMLDNLQIGITPTKEGFQEIIDKVNEWNATNGKATRYMMGNLADMQSALVDYISMVGYAGYAQKESLSTISGSIASTKAAWNNLITGISDDTADFGQLLDNFFESVSNTADLLVPRIGVALEGSVKFIGGIFSKFIRGLPTFFKEQLPGIVTSVVNGVAEILKAAADAFPGIVRSLIPTLVGLSKTLIPTLVPVIISLLLALTDPEITNEVTNASAEIIANLVDGFIEAIPELAPAIVEIVMNIIRIYLGMKFHFARLGLDTIISILSGFISGIPKIPSVIGDMAKSFWDGIKGMINDAKTWGMDLIDNFVDGVKSKWKSLVDTVGDVAQSIKDFLGFSEPDKGPLSNFHTYAPDMMDLFTKGIADNEPKLVAQVAKTFDFKPIIESGYGTETGGGVGASNDITININVAGANGDPSEIASAVSYELQRLLNRRSAVYG